MVYPNRIASENWQTPCQSAIKVLPKKQQKPEVSILCRRLSDRGLLLEMVRWNAFEKLRHLDFVQPEWTISCLVVYNYDCLVSLCSKYVSPWNKPLPEYFGNPWDGLQGQCTNIECSFCGSRNKVLHITNFSLINTVY